MNHQDRRFAPRSDMAEMDVHVTRRRETGSNVHGGHGEETSIRNGWSAVERRSQALRLRRDDSHAGDPFRHEVIIFDGGLDLADFPRGRRGGDPGAHLVRAEARDAVDLRVAHGVEDVGLAGHEFVEEIAVPLLARRQARPLADDHVAGGAHHAVFPRIEFVLRRDMPLDQPLCDIGRTHLETRSRRIVRQSAGTDQGQPQIRPGQELADRLAELPRPAERRPRIGGAVDEHRQHIVAAERAGQLVERDRHAMVDPHVVRERQIEVLVLQKPDARQSELARHPQGTAFEVPILASHRRRADAEGRHQLIKEAVEVIRAKDHHQIRIERMQFPGTGIQLPEERCVGLRLCFLYIRRHQRAMRATDQLNRHLRFPSYPFMPIGPLALASTSIL